MKLSRAPAVALRKQWRAVLAEFVATMLLIFFGCLSCIPIEGLASMTVLLGSLGFGLAVMFNIQIFLHISGAFMNPLITVMAVIWERIPVSLGMAYVIAECAGALVGYGLLVVLAPIDVAAEGICVTVPYQISAYQALGIELLLAMALALIECSVFDPAMAHNTDSLPLKYGLAITGLSIAGSPYTGGGLNPARSLGPAVWANKWEAHWVYWVGPLVGGLVTAIFYKYVWLQPRTEEKSLT